MLGSSCSPCCASGCDSCVSGVVPSALSVAFTLRLGNGVRQINLNAPLHPLETPSLGGSLSSSEVCHLYECSWVGAIVGYGPESPWYNDVDNTITFTNDENVSVTETFGGILQFFFTGAKSATPNRFAIGMYPQGGSIWWSVHPAVDISPGNIVYESESQYSWQTYYGQPYKSLATPCYSDFGSVTLPSYVRFYSFLESSFTIEITGVTP